MYLSNLRFRVHVYISLPIYTFNLLVSEPAVFAVLLFLVFFGFSFMLYILFFFTWSLVARAFRYAENYIAVYRCSLTCMSLDPNHYLDVRHLFMQQSTTNKRNFTAILGGFSIHKQEQISTHHHLNKRVHPVVADSEVVS